MLRIVVITALLLGGVSVAQQPAKRSSRRPEFRPFVGTWRLVSSTEKLPDGSKRPYGFGEHPVGYLMYDATGHVCAQVVDSDRPHWHDSDHPTAQELQSAFEGFGGYCGTFTVDPAAHTLTHLPEVPFEPNAVGRPSPRTYKMEGKRLLYTGKDTDHGTPVDWTMEWERVE